MGWLKNIFSKFWHDTTFMLICVGILCMGIVVYSLAKNRGFFEKWFGGTTCEEAFKSAVASGYLGFYCLTSDRNATHCTKEVKEKARQNLLIAINQCRAAKAKYTKCEDEYEDWLSCLAKGPRKHIECEEEERAKEFCINKNYRL